MLKAEQKKQAIVNQAALRKMRVAFFLRSVLLIFALFSAVHLTIANTRLVPVPEKTIALAVKRYGSRARLRLNSWHKVVIKSAKKTEMEKLKAVNYFFNRIRYVSDKRHWGRKDYWATPVEMLASNGADCEDFAIAKYFTLKELGVKEEKLKIMYVKATRFDPVNQAHMVLAYYKTPSSVPLLLDNLISKIKPATQRRDLIPVYAFSGQGLWLAKSRSLGRVSNSPSNIRPWQSVKARMSREY